MLKILTTYLAVVALLTLGFLGLGTLRAAELRDPMQPPPFALKKFQQAKWAKQPKVVKPKVDKPKQEPLKLTSILISNDRKIAIIDDQMLKLGDKIRDAKLISLSRDSARLLRNGKVINLSLNNELTAIRKKAVESDL